ncbi:MAG: FmdB family zinc ribbon protein [Bacillota bacterium]|jgi:putative FmdB family regulatory protein
MPKYDYSCDKCGVFEVTQPITEPPLEQCPYCGGNVKRLISSNVNIIFKGSGFYKTEYRSQDYIKKLKEEDKAKAPAKEKKKNQQSSTAAS